MAAPLRRQSQRKSRIADNINIGNRVHLNGDFQAHKRSFSYDSFGHIALRLKRKAGR
jgi:hypothetical protein